MKTRFLLLFVICVMAGAAHARSIFVDKASPTPSPDGSAAKPFRTITQALILARGILLGSPGNSSSETINVHVAAGTYDGKFGPSDDPALETLPLLLNVPRLKLQGALRFNSTGQIVPGTETILRSTTRQLEKQHMVVVTRTNSTISFPNPTFEWAGDAVTISGFFFEGVAKDGSTPTPANAPGSALVSIDGVSGFLVSGSVFTHAGSFGITTRLASASIANNHFIANSGVGINVTAGSKKFPATVEIVGNHVRDNGVGGIGLQGAAQTENDRADLFASQNFQRVPLPEFYNRTNRPQEVPDQLDASVKGNDVSGSGRFGIHVNGYIRDFYTLRPIEAALTANVRAQLVGNAFRSNGNYGIVVTAGQIKLPNAQTHTVNLDVSFDSTTLEANGTGPALFGFWRFATSADLGEESNLTFKLAHDSTIRICGDVTQFSFDNRAVDPTDNTATNNALTVNTLPLTGLCVPVHDNCIFKLPAIPCH